MEISIQDGIKLRFRQGPVCPHCGSNSINKFGFFRGKQRYRCKECKKTFNLYTKTLLSWSHYKDKWGSFITACKKDMSLREAEKEVGVSYVTLFYWRHKIMTILNEENDARLHGILELTNMKLKYLNKYHYGKEYDEDDDGGARDVIFTFLYQRDNRLESYIYKEKIGARSFIYKLSDSIDEKSIVCLTSNYPFRLPLLYKDIKVADKKKYKRIGYFNADRSRKYLKQFRSWMKIFRGVSSKNLLKYAALFKTHKIFNNMEGIILYSLLEWRELTNQNSIRGELGF